MPRTYDMSKRRAQVEQTRERIVEATMDLHSSQGILATSWEEIAEKAGVAPGTVYRHYPTLEELLPACGERSLAVLDLPDDDRVAQLFADPGGEDDRLRTLVGELFSIYERGSRVIWAIRRDRASLPALEEANAEIEERLDALTRTALAPRRPGQTDVARVRALTDYDVWRALNERGIEGTEAVELTVRMLRAALTEPPTGRRKR